MPEEQYNNALCFIYKWFDGVDSVYEKEASCYDNQV